MLFDIHVPGKTGTVLYMRTHGYIMVNVQIFHGFWPKFKALFKATECESLMLVIKTIGPGE
jgi:hypothetical protein